MSPRDDLAYTLGFTAAVALACSAIVALSAEWLRPRQQAWAQIGHARAVIGALTADHARSDADVIAAFLQLEPLWFDLRTGSVLAMPGAAANAGAIVLDASSDVAGLGTVPGVMPLYRDPASGRMAWPLIARGMWSQIDAWLGLEPDRNTIVALAIETHGETPGIGDRIEEPQWLAGWAGRRLRDATGDRQLVITTAATAAADAFHIDGITGATMTVAGLGRALDFWFGPAAFGAVSPQPVAD